MTPQFAHVIYKSTIKQSRKLGVITKDNYIAWRSDARWDDELQEVVQDVWAWSKIKALAREYKQSLRK